MAWQEKALGRWQLLFPELCSKRVVAVTDTRDSEAYFTAAVALGLLRDADTSTWSCSLCVEPVGLCNSGEDSAALRSPLAPSLSFLQGPALCWLLLARSMLSRKHG